MMGNNWMNVECGDNFVINFIVFLDEMFIIYFFKKLLTILKIIIVKKRRPKSVGVHGM